MSEKPAPRRWYSSVRYKNLNEFMSVSSRFHDIAREFLPKDRVQEHYMVLNDSIDSNMPVLSSVRDACVQFRHRPVHVTVLEVQYLPLSAN